MSEPRDGSTPERELWRRWADAEAAGALPADLSGPDALLLAAFAEDRLAGSVRPEVEAFLAANPEIAGDVAAARGVVGAARNEDAAAPAAVIARAAALVKAADIEPGGEVLSFPARRAVPAWPVAARWGALAASLVLVSWLGFALGRDASVGLAALDGQMASVLADELLDPSAGFFGLVDPSGT